MKISKENELSKLALSASLKIPFFQGIYILSREISFIFSWENRIIP
jgi:hypothetical protein